MKLDYRQTAQSLLPTMPAETGPRRAFELAFAPLARRLGWRPEFPWERLVNWAAKHGGVTLTERRPMPPMGHFSLIRYRKS